MQLGKKQWQMLAALGSPGMAMIVPDKIALSLVKRGILRTDKGAFACITPSGLRWLAYGLENGKIEGALEWAAREREKNLKKSATAADCPTEAQ